MKERLQHIIRVATSRQGAIILLWIAFAGLSLGTMMGLTSRLREREENYIRLWVQSMVRLYDADYDNVINEIVNERSSIPFIIITTLAFIIFYYAFIR